MKQLFSKKKKSKEQEADAQIKVKLKKGAQTAQKTISLLLLGAGGSGKSTVLKQMEKLYKGSIEEKSMEDAVYYIRGNVLEDVFDLARYNIELLPKHPECNIEDKQLAHLRDELSRFSSGSIEEQTMTPEVAKDIAKLWDHPAMKATFEIRRKSHIMDNTPYFLDKVEHIASSEYVATFDDYVRLRHRTTGLVSQEFEVNFESQTWIFSVTDVGGQRAERKKWIHVFSDVNAVLFVMSLAGYDQVLFEDHSTNCWKEAISLFEDTIHLKPFADTDFIVFLNKNDLFEEKIKTIGFDVYDKTCPAEHKNDAQWVTKFCQNKFETIFNADVEDPETATRTVHFHVTCAIDETQIQTVMGFIQFEAVRAMLKKSALM